jgi:hypothetical protein
MNKFITGVGVFVLIIIVAVVALFSGLVERNDYQNFQIWQGVTGKVAVIDQPGYYGKWFGKVWTYPRVQEAFFSSSEKEGGREDDSISVTFNDGGKAKISTFVRYELPALKDERLSIHKSFAGNPDNIKSAVRSALINCCKNTAPLMSSSEHQSARKAEFANLIEEQLRHGIYEMRRIEKVYKDKTDEEGNPITVYVTEIVRDKTGKPIVAQQSPLKQYKIEILQFSVTGTEYDSQTIKQFEAKKDAFLKAELSKSQREEEVQQRLKVIEEGKRRIAEMEAKMNVEKIRAVTEGKKKAEVAEQQKRQAEIEANQKLEVAKIEKQEALTRAQREQDVARIMLEKAKLEAQAKIELAKAKQKEIELSGAITEKERVLAQIQAEKEVRVAEHLAKIAVPANVIVGGGDAKSSGLSSTLMNMLMLEKMGVLKPKAKPVKATR